MDTAALPIYWFDDGTLPHSIWRRHPRNWGHWAFSGKYPSRSEAMHEIDKYAHSLQDKAERVALPCGVLPVPEC